MGKKKEDPGFLYGVLVALGIVSSHGHMTIYDEIVSASSDIKELLEKAKENDLQYDLLHLNKYVEWKKPD